MGGWKEDNNVVTSFMCPHQSFVEHFTIGCLVSFMQVSQSGEKSRLSLQMLNVVLGFLCPQQIYATCESTINVTRITAWTVSP